MKKIIIYLSLMILLALFVNAGTHQDWLILEQDLVNFTHGVGDLYIVMGNPSVSFYDNSLMAIQRPVGTGKTFGFVRFNISKYDFPTNATLIDCDFYLRFHSGVGSEYLQAWVLKDSLEYYSMNNLTWDNAPCLDRTNTILTADDNNCTLVQSRAYQNINIDHFFNETAVFNACNTSLNDGSLLVFVIGHNVTTSPTIYYSSDSAIETRPKLLLTFTYPEYTTLIINATNTDNSSQLISNYTITIIQGATTYTNSTTTGYLNFTDLSRDLNVTLFIESVGYYSQNLTNYDFTAENVSIQFNMTPLGRTNTTFFNHIDNTAITESFQMEIISPSSSKNVSVVNGNYFIEDLEIGITEFRYYIDGYRRNNYFYNVNYNTSTTLRLYAINESDSISDDIIIYLYDGYSNALENYFIVVAKYFEDCHCTRTVEMQKTGLLGDSLFYLRKYDTSYRIYVYDPDYNLVYATASNNYITQDVYTIQLNLDDDPLGSYRTFNDITYSLTYINLTNTTGQFELTYSDTNGIADNICLKVVRRNPITETNYCYDCSTGDISTILCAITDTSEGNYIATFMLDTTINGSWYTIDSIEVVFSDMKDIFGKEGLFYAALVLLVFIMIGIFDPSISLALLTLGVILLSLLGILPVGYVGVAMLTGSILFYLVLRKQ